MSELRAGWRLAVHRRPVLAAKVLEDPALTGPEQTCMLLRDPRVLEHETTLGVATDDERLTVPNDDEARGPPGRIECQLRRHLRHLRDRVWVMLSGVRYLFLRRARSRVAPVAKEPHWAALSERNGRSLRIEAPRHTRHFFFFYYWLVLRSRLKCSVSAADRSKPATLMALGSCATQTSGMTVPLSDSTSSEKVFTTPIAAIVCPKMKSMRACVEERLQHIHHDGWYQSSVLVQQGLKSIELAVDDGVDRPVVHDDEEFGKIASGASGPVAAPPLRTP